jgi:predicted ATPase
MATAPSKETGEEVDDWTKPPFLRRVRIQGYKSIAFCDVQLQPLTILVGRNASGKSNFLDALAFLRDVLRLGVNEAVQRHGGTAAIPTRSGRETLLQFEVEASYNDAESTLPWNALYQIAVKFPKDRAAEISYEHFRVEHDDFLWVGYINEEGEVNCGAGGDKPQVYRWGIKDRPFLDAYRDSPVPEFAERFTSIAVHNFYPDAIRALQHPNPGSMLARDGHNLASVIGSLRDHDRTTFQRVRDYLVNISEEIETFGTIRYGEYETVRFRLRGGSEDKPLEFDAASMSDGTLRALAALVAAFQIHLPDGPSVIGIEEPETALHPAATQALVDALDEATQRTQVILTTHSADLLSGRDITPGQVLVVRNRGGQTQITPVDPASREIIEKELYTLADLQRMDQLNLDEADLKRQEHLRNGSEGD